jgi:hypothetical protein
MHGLIFDLSLPFWQDQPGNEEKLISKKPYRFLPLNLPSLLATLVFEFVQSFVLPGGASALLSFGVSP